MIPTFSTNKPPCEGVSVARDQPLWENTLDILHITLDILWAYNSSDVAKYHILATQTSVGE